MITQRVIICSIRHRLSLFMNYAQQPRTRVRSAVGGCLYVRRERNRRRSSTIECTAIERSAWSSTIPSFTGSSECSLFPRAKVPALPFVRTASRLSPAFAGSRGWGLLMVPGLAPWATLCPAAFAASRRRASRPFPANARERARARERERLTAISGYRWSGSAAC
jgi:hypothetical protein